MKTQVPDVLAESDLLSCVCSGKKIVFSFRVADFTDIV